MRHLGEADAAPVSEGLAGSLHYIVAVLNGIEPVDAAAIHRFAGQVLTDSRRPLIFAATSCTEEAIAFANQVNIPLFVYDAVNGNLAAHNAVAGELIRTGL